MVIIDTVINTLFGGLTLDPAGMHCPARDDAFVSSYVLLFQYYFTVTLSLISSMWATVTRSVSWPDVD